SRPANTGPIIDPTPAVVTTSARARSRMSSSAESLSHEIPADQIVPEPTPKAARAARSAAKLGATAVPSIAAAAIADATRVTMRAPKRSLRRPAGTDATTMARLAADSSAPALTSERWYARV